MTSEYSINTTINGRSPQKTFIVGNFNSDPKTVLLEFQGSLLDSLEFAIQGVVNPKYDIGVIPIHENPSEYVPQSGDIFVSFPNNNDYFIFRRNMMDSLEREVLFYSKGLNVTTYKPEISESTVDYKTFISNRLGVEYKLTYKGLNEFSIKDNRGKLLTYNDSGCRYDDHPLVINRPGMSVITYNQGSYSDVGITVFPEVLPEDKSKLPVADILKGIFYKESGIGYNNLSNHILSQGYGIFTLTQREFIINFIQNSFLVLSNAVRHVIRVNNKEYFSTNNKISSETSYGNISIEIVFS